MQIRAALTKSGEKLRHSYWFIPSLTVGAGAALSLATLELDTRFHTAGRAYLYSGSVEGARALLQTVAQSMLSTAGVVFSVTVVVLTLAAKQYGARMLRNFMRDTGNQIVLGMFLGTFLCALLVLRQVHSTDGPAASGAVPHLSMLTVVLLTVVSIGLLIYFIHHMAESIQSPIVVERLARELEESIEQLYPEPAGQVPREELERGSLLAAQLPDEFGLHAGPIPAGKAGYIQRVQTERLVATAARHDLIIEVASRPGKFVLSSDTVLRVWPKERLTKQICSDCADMFSVGRQRTTGQDLEFPIDQCVEIALIAMTPGVGDPFTTINCVDRLTECLARLAGRRIPSPYQTDQQGKLRLIAYPVDFSKMMAAAFNQIRQSSKSYPAVMLRLLKAYQRIAAHALEPAARAAIRLHAELVYRQAIESVSEPYDRDAIERRYRAVAGMCS